MLWWTLRQMKSKNPNTRRQAVELLGESRDSRVVEPVMAMLNDSDSDVRRAAAKVLYAIRDPRAVEPLIALLKDSDSSVASWAASALGQIGDARAVESLIAALSSVSRVTTFGGLPDRDVREAAIMALGEIGDPRAAQPLFDALDDDYVRIKAASALSQIGNAAVEWLALALNHGNDDVRWRAADALMKIEKISDARAVDPLINALKDNESRVREAAEGALEKIGDAAVESLIAALNDTNCNVRRSAKQALERIAPKRSAKFTEPLRKAQQGIETLEGCMRNDVLHSQEQEILKQAIGQLKAAGQHGSRELASFIEELLDSRSSNIDRALVAAQKMKRIPELVTIIEAVTVAPALRNGNRGSYLPEIFGDGCVGWTDGTHERVRELAGRTLVILLKTS